jgi:hypothetical protein
MNHRTLAVLLVCSALAANARDARGFEAVFAVREDLEALEGLCNKHTGFDVKKFQQEMNQKKQNKSARERAMVEMDTVQGHAVCLTYRALRDVYGMPTDKQLKEAGVKSKNLMLITLMMGLGTKLHFQTGGHFKWENYEKDTKDLNVGALGELDDNQLEAKVGFTNAELFLILTNPQLEKKTTWWKGDAVLEACPFKHGGSQPKKLEVDEKVLAVVKDAAFHHHLGDVIKHKKEDVLMACAAVVKSVDGDKEEFEKQFPTLLEFCKGADNANYAQ